MPPATDVRAGARALPFRWALLVTACALLLAARPAPADPRPPEVMDAARLRLAIEKLGVTGSVLFVAAHPDDENTAFLAWLANGRKLRTAYLSITRGDGGQNLIGSDTGELLGVIRTQELLAARRIDGAEQFFTRAIDFGYSKNANETLAIWGREPILADVVWVIRRFRPDVIVTRFAPDSTAGHGHHSASAILAEEAFAAAADSTRFREQLRWVKPWQAKRLMRNVGRFGGARPDTTPGRLSVDLGAYDRLLGRSYTEIAGESRSMHKSQGFGAAERRGTWTNSFEHKLGARAALDLFEGVDFGWSRFPGGPRLKPILAQAVREFHADRPQSVVPVLLRAHAILATMGDDPVIERKRQELNEVIRSCTGLWIEAIASTATTSPGRRIRVVASVLNRSDVPMTLESVMVGVMPGPGSAASIARGGSAGRTLEFNVAVNDTLSIEIPAEVPNSEPYWLRNRPLRGAFEVDEPLLTGIPENPPVMVARFRVEVGGQRLEFTTPVVHRWTDPVAGERYRALDIVPPVTMRFDEGAYLFADERPREMRVTAQGSDGAVEGALSLQLPEGWSASPGRALVRLAAGSDTTVRFMVTPGAAPAAGVVAALFEIGSARHGERLVRLDYPHVPIQTLLPPAEARLVRTDLRIGGKEIGYLMGSGDQGPEALRQMGFQVTLLEDEDVERMDLSRFHAIVAGVRAYNTRPRLRAHQRRLLAYAEAGGRLVLQYDTAEEALQDRLGPYPFRISRERVTVEEAPVTPLKPDHPLLTTPNRIGAADFEGWVQERGLYFAGPWDSRYESVLSSRDPGEPARDGGLLFARVGKGAFIYTGYAFFRQLPAGVPGAWRLFANLVSATP